MGKDYVIGIDCSTTATKAIVWDRKGLPLAEGRKGMESLFPKPEWAEQKPEEWWNATVSAIRKVVLQVDPRRIAAIGITHQREGFVPVDADLTPLRAGILWIDTRAKKQVRELEEWGAEKIHKITGIYPYPYTSHCKIMWIRENEPSVFFKTFKFLDVFAYLALRLTGKIVTTFPSASPWGLLNIKKLDWDNELLEVMGIKKEQLPELKAPGDIVGTLTKEAASFLGLPEGVPVVGGGGDGQCAALGAGVVEEGLASLNLGTSVVSELFAPSYVIGDSFRTLCGCVPGTYIAESINGGGTYLINWMLDKFGSEEKKLARINGIQTEDIFEIMAGKIKPGTPRLLLVPYWKGSFTPYHDPFARGIVVGWSGDTGKAHLYRAILEGIAFEQRLLYEKMEKSLKSKIKKVVLLGGGAKSSLWCQLIADITSRPALLPHTFEATCLGAAMLAACAAGMYKSVEDASRGMSRTVKEYRPNKTGDYEQVYKHLFPKMRELVDEFTRLALE